MIDNYKSCCSNAILIQANGFYYIRGCGIEIINKEREIAEIEFCKQIATKRAKR